MSILPFPTARMLPGIKPLDSAAPAAPRAIVSDLSAILARAEPPAPAPQPAAHATLPPLTIIARGMRALKKLTGFIGKSQAATVRSALREEEGQWFMEKMEELANLIEGMPVTYGQDGKGDDAICYLHYFGPNYDLWITEKDMEKSENPAEAQWQAHGYTHWAQNGAHVSMGYICLPEILAAGAELDFHFKPRPVREVKRKLGIEVKEPAAADCLKAPGSDSDAANSGDSRKPLGCLNSDSDDAAAAADPEPPAAPKSTGIFGGWETLSEQIPHGAVLFCRLGDFYETFAHHAKLAAPLLQVALTKRNMVPMCGFPVHAQDSYIKRLLEAGHSVMLAEFDKDSGKAIVQRAITPPSAADEDPLITRQKSFLAMEDGYQAGAIISYSWGWEQTNYNYYRIEKRSGEFVTLIPLVSRSTPTGDMHSDEFPTDTPKDYAKDHDPAWGNKNLEKPKPTFRRKLTIRDGKPSGFSISSGTGWARLWEGRVGKATHYA